MLVRLFLVIAALVSVTPAMAGADSDVIRKLGLVGTWATDCSKPPSTNNVYVELTAPSVGFPIRSAYSQRGHATFFEMRSVRLIAPNRIAYLDVRKSDGDLTNIVIELLGGQWRTYESTDPKDGKVYVKDGKLVDSGMPTAFEMKCSGR